MLNALMDAFEALLRMASIDIGSRWQASTEEFTEAVLEILLGFLFLHIVQPFDKLLVG
jgi:hypothetical protein